ncbi:MAG: SAM-dependent DNA methyltransferase, partial [Candidatus Lokiarchaeota archaeon]|nr:SAM-dependent DNA methyltransferase [Candidatus Lokiarchaeota archaeon]
MNKKREKSIKRKFGSHITSIEIFNQFILPDIKKLLLDYIWIDLYAGEGNLILPILNEISLNDRREFFKDHIYLFDVQPSMVNKCIANAFSYGIPEYLAKNNIKLRDNLENFPSFLKRKNIPIFHITNPPYLYLGYIRKHQETQNYLKYFENENRGYQDLYQIAMMNDLRNEIENLIYIIPTNFLFGASVSNKFRHDFLKHYKILKMIIFETKVFEYTGTNICIGFFKKKRVSKV